MSTRTMLGGKIHRCTVTQADLRYEGSITIDEDLMDAADLLPHEAVWVWNVDNSERFSTYALVGPRGSGMICVNGAAARKVAVGDKIIIAYFKQVPEDIARTWEPLCIFVDDKNRQKMPAGEELVNFRS